VHITIDDIERNVYENGDITRINNINDREDIFLYFFEVSQNGSLLELASDTIKNNKDIVLLAVKHPRYYNYEVIQNPLFFASDNLINNIVLAAINAEIELYKTIDEPGVYIQLEHDSPFICASQELKLDKDVIAASETLNIAMQSAKNKHAAAIHAAAILYN
jgi:hypothetical protein